MTIGFVLRCLVRGGAERQVVDLAVELERRGHECSVYTFDGGEAGWTELETAGVRVVDIGGGRAYAGGVRSLVRHLSASRTQVVNPHQPMAGAFAAAACSLARVAHVFTVENLGVGHPTRVKAAEAIVRAHAARVVCVSREAQRRVECALGPLRANREKTLVIHNGVDVSRLRAAAASVDARSMRATLGFPQDVPVVATVGRFEPEKRQSDLLRAFAIVRRRVPDARLLVVGWGRLAKRLREHAQMLEISDAVRFVEDRADVPALVAAADVFAFPSRYEGLGVALLEAMAIGTPVVANCVPPLTEVVRNGLDGRLVDTADAASFADALTQTIEDRETSSRLARSARRRVESEFSISASADKYERLFATLDRGAPVNRG